MMTIKVENETQYVRKANDDPDRFDDLRIWLSRLSATERRFIASGFEGLGRAQ
jgi:hypothetical protein